MKTMISIYTTLSFLLMASTLVFASVVEDPVLLSQCR